MKQTFMYESARVLCLQTCGQTKRSCPIRVVTEYSSWGLRDAAAPTRHHSCSLPDKRLKHSWGVFSTMADSTLFGYGGIPTSPSFLHSTPPTPPLPLHTSTYLLPHLIELSGENINPVWSDYRMCSCRGRTGISLSLLCLWPFENITD